MTSAARRKPSIAVPPVNPDPTSAITAPPGYPERQRDPELRGDDPVGDLPHLLARPPRGRRPRSAARSPGPSTGSKLVLSLAGRVATCCAT